jgi:hypothetical protein
VGTVEEIQNTVDPIVRQFIDGRATLDDDMQASPFSGVPRLNR